MHSFKVTTNRISKMGNFDENDSGRIISVLPMGVSIKLFNIVFKEVFRFDRIKLYMCLCLRERSK